MIARIPANLEVYKSQVHQVEGSPWAVLKGLRKLRHHHVLKSEDQGKAIGERTQRDGTEMTHSLPLWEHQPMCQPRS